MKGIIVGSSLVKYSSGNRILRTGCCTFSFPGGRIVDIRTILENVQEQLDFIVIQIGTNDISEIHTRKGEHWTAQDIKDHVTMLVHYVEQFCRRHPETFVIVSAIPPKIGERNIENLRTAWNKILRVTIPKDTKCITHVSQVLPLNILSTRPLFYYRNVSV